MTTLLQEFEEWQKDYYIHNSTCLNVAIFVEAGQKKLEELKAKYKIGQ